MVVGDGSVVVVVVGSNTWTTLLLEVVSLYVDEYVQVKEYVAQQIHVYV